MLSRRCRARETLNQQEDASIALSFLDLVSAGFGGAVFLFIIFATLPISEKRDGGGGGGSHFIDLWLEWAPFNEDGINVNEDGINMDGINVEALVELRIEHEAPGTEERRIFRLGNPRAEIATATDSLSFGQEQPPWSDLVVVGYDRDGDYAPLNATDKRYLHARIIDPAAGEWSLFANLYRYRNIETRKIHSPTTREHKMEGEWLCSGGRATEPQPIELTISGEPHPDIPAIELFVCDIVRSR